MQPGSQEFSTIQIFTPTPALLQVKVPTRTVIITGPNTGGKTAALKALGLAVLAAKCGLPVPAAAPARLPCFDAVLADIGGSCSCLLASRWFLLSLQGGCQAGMLSGEFV
jgi:hypothetical protein